MSASKWRRELDAKAREEAGLPVLRCPSCGEFAAHWQPDTLDDYGLIIPGYFTCEGGDGS